MRWLITALLVLSAVAVAPFPASAGSCPAGFDLHTVGHGDHEHGEHRHVGVSEERVDRNANGQICVKHATPADAIHVHIDDLVP